MSGTHKPKLKACAENEKAKRDVTQADGLNTSIKRQAVVDKKSGPQKWYYYQPFPNIHSP